MFVRNKIETELTIHNALKYGFASSIDYNHLWAVLFAVHQVPAFTMADQLTEDFKRQRRDERRRERRTGIAQRQNT